MLIGGAGNNFRAARYKVFAHHADNTYLKALSTAMAPVCCELYGIKLRTQLASTAE